jgi:NAD-dependent dihydropyrimidine dehydrogenase PreA subunit
VASPVRADIGQLSFFGLNLGVSGFMPATVDAEKCSGCGECVASCPLDAIKVVDNVANVDDSCGDCGACVDVCPTEAISLS